MRVITTILFVLAVAATSFAQVTKKTLELPEFKSIYVNSNYTVYLKQTNKQEVKVEALADIYAVTEIKVEDGILMINVERKPEAPNKSLWAKIDDIKLNPTMKVYVNVKDINALQVNGRGKIISENSIASDDLEIGLTGSGSMDLDVKGKKITTDISGSGTVALKGYATSNKISLSGTGILNAFNCELENATITVGGSGIAEIKVAENLEAFVMGSGSIKHKGNTKNVTKKVYGSGSVDRAY
ncbi:MAG TPA: head GIN domain-containing protein [Cyclobacteriaceae bacterium]|nr:head GIN domain-containing protein [Cyclobacteriaceae bacterium]